MALAVFVFVLFAGAIAGGYAAVMYLPGMLASRELDKRLKDVTMAPAATPGGEASEAIVKKDAHGPLPGVDRILSRIPIGSYFAKLIEQSGVHTTASAMVLASVAAALIAAFLTDTFVRLPFVPLAAGLFGMALPTLWLRHRRTRRMRRFEEQFPEALDLLSRAIRAGHAFQTAMGMVAEELPPPVGPEFKKTFDQQNFGLPLREALWEMSARIPLLDVRFFVTAVLIQRDTGGNLSEILDNLAHVVRERFKILRQVRVHTAHGRFTGYVLLALPASLAVALTFIAPDMMQLLYRERIGQMLITVAIVLQVVGFIWIRQVIKIEV